MENLTMKKTVLYERHRAIGAKIMPFAGYSMPIQYISGILSEHSATRKAATVFDTCHMGEFTIWGDSVERDLEHILSCPVSSIAIGQCRYGFICNENGGVIDDQILYRRSEKEFFMVVNAATESIDYAWITEHLSSGTHSENISADIAKIDLQGPFSPGIALKIFKQSIAELKYYRCMENSYHGNNVLVSRTGYTGEIGFEIYCPTECAGELWDECIALGAEPAGLGARDTLRLEMGFPLYGHELDTDTDASWSGFQRAIGRKTFIGSSMIGNRDGTQYALCGLLIDGRRTAHQGNSIIDDGGRCVGRITSGSFAPTLRQAIALGYIDRTCILTEGSRYKITTDRGPLDASISALPFYRNGTARAPIENFLPRDE